MTANKRTLGSNLQKVDAYELTAEDYAEIPELPDAFFEQGVLHRNGVPVPRGRPPSAMPKQQVTLRLDAEVLERFRSDGPGWQGRINAALRKAVGV